MQRSRDGWVDAVKIYACILVVLGHFAQSMVSSDIVEGGALYGWFNRTIYYFHVPLFFVCSGYLYQRYSRVRTLSEWRCNIAKKLLSLGIPYLTFSAATWLLKAAFADSVNNAQLGFVHTLFVSPASPYWYLYALLLIFALTPTFEKRTEAICAAIAVTVLKCLSFLPVAGIPCVGYILEDSVWFVGGMLLSYFDIPSKMKNVGWAVILPGSGAFLAVSILLYRYTEWSAPVSFAMGLFGVICTLSAALKLDGWLSGGRVLSFLSRYTFPVFLMHTIFAAGLRSVLLKVGITGTAVHCILGITVSFAAPVIAAYVMSKIRWTEFLLYPNKVIRTGGSKNGKET